MLVDLEITAAGQRQREPAVFGDLLQHVIVKTDSGIDFGRPGRSRSTVTLMSVSLVLRPDRRDARPVENIADDSSQAPGSSAIDFEAADADVAGQRQVRVPIADDDAALAIDWRVSRMNAETRPGFAVCGTSIHRSQSAGR